MKSRDGSSGRSGGDERHSKGAQTSCRTLVISRSRPASVQIGPGIEWSRNMFHGEVEFGKSKSPTLRLVNDVSGDVGVEAGRREHIQDVLVASEQREFSTCGEQVRKASDACHDRILFFAQESSNEKMVREMSQTRKRL